MYGNHANIVLTFFFMIIHENFYISSQNFGHFDFGKKSQESLGIKKPFFTEIVTTNKPNNPPKIEGNSK